MRGRPAPIIRNSWPCLLLLCCSLWIDKFQSFGVERAAQDACRFGAHAVQLQQVCFPDGRELLQAVETSRIERPQGWFGCPGRKVVLEAVIFLRCQVDFSFIRKLNSSPFIAIFADLSV